MKPKLLSLWRDFAYQVASLSTCERTKVGVLCLSRDGEQLLAYGYNGGPRGGENKPATDSPGTDFWIHAEENALVKPRGLVDFVVLATHTPCFRCAGLLLNSGARKALFLTEYRDPAGWHRCVSHPSRFDDFLLYDAKHHDELAGWFGR